jgi:signal transduction histidine kinase
VLLKRLIFVVFLLMSIEGYARLSVQLDGVTLYNDTLGMEIFFDPVADFSDAGMERVLQESWRPVVGIEQGMNYSESCIWLRIPLEKIANSGIFARLVIENPHLNRLKLWIFKGDVLVYTSPLTGDATPFFSRIFDARNFIFTVDAHANKGGYLLLAVDNRATRLALPLHFQSEPYFLGNHDFDFKWVLFFLGFAFFLLLFNVYLFLTTGDAAFGWYIVYLVLICMFLCMDVGWFFKVFYPRMPEVNNVIRLATFAASIAPMLLFFNSVVGVREYSRRLDMFNKSLTGLYLVIFVVGVFNASLNTDPEFRQLWVVLSRFITITILSVLLIESIYFMRKGNVMALFSLASLCSLTFFFLGYLGFRLERLPGTLLTTYGVYWGLASDTFFMGISLAYRFRQLRQRVLQLTREKALRQLQFTMEISNWKQQQMQQLATFLHDRIGGLMGVLRLTVDTMALEPEGRAEVADEIETIKAEILQYSQFHASGMLRTQGLKETISELSRKLERKTNIKFWIEWEGEEEINPEQIRIFLYFCIQEMFQNMLKYASCSSVIVRVQNAPENVKLYFKDNGVGCENIEDALGSGLKTMKRIVDLLGGYFEVVSAPDEGFSLSVELANT